MKRIWIICSVTVVGQGVAGKGRSRRFVRPREFPVDEASGGPAAPNCGGQVARAVRPCAGSPARPASPTIRGSAVTARAKVGRLTARGGPDEIADLVHCRVGSSENGKDESDLRGKVHCRTGSSEMRARRLVRRGGVHCRITVGFEWTNVRIGLAIGMDWTCSAARRPAHRLARSCHRMGRCCVAENMGSLSGPRGGTARRIAAIGPDRFSRDSAEKCS